jgi:deoxyadenosine/deoxycytidine kinase
LYKGDVEVYNEQTNEKFLELFYSDPKRYGFALQWGMLKSRIYQLRLAQHDARHGRVPPKSYFYWDRSMIGDYIFALLNHLTGSISKQEMLVYESGALTRCRLTVVF